MLLIDYDKWMQQTDLGHLHFRSSRLRRVDDAIRSYQERPSEQGGFAIAEALADWERARQIDGAGSSARDGSGAIASLRHQLRAQGYDPSGDLDRIFNEGDRQALGEVHTAQRTALQITFTNAKVIFHPDGVAGPSEDPEWLAMLLTPDAWIKEKVTTFIQQAGASAMEKIQSKLHLTQGMVDIGKNVADMFYGILNAAFGDRIWAQIKNTPLGTYIVNTVTKVTEVLEAMIPAVVSAIWDTRQVALEWAQLAYHARHIFDIGYRRYDLEIGTPTAALSGMRSALRHELSHSFVEASISTGAYAGKLVAAHADAGAFTSPLIGLGEALGKLAHFLTHIAYQSKAAFAMRQALNDPSTLGLGVFRDFPLLGAYYLNCTTFSNLVPLSFMGTPGWMDRIERLNHRMDGIFVDARRLINTCPYKIIGLQKIQQITPDADAESNEFWQHIANAFGGTADAVDDIANTAIGQAVA